MPLRLERDAIGTVEVAKDFNRWVCPGGMPEPH